MSQLRHDPLSGADVIVAAGRAARPVTSAPMAPVGAAIATCPFCPGHESETPPEVARTGSGAADTPAWRVRAFPNLYPIVDAHEVVVLSPDHSRSFADLDDDAAVEVMTMLRDRIRVHLGAGCAYGFAILNHLRAAGASIAHPHAQVFGLEVVPTGVEAAVARVRDAGHDLVAADAAFESLVVAREHSVTTWCPHASTSPYLMRLAHDDAGPRFDAATDTMIAEVARAVRGALVRFRAIIGDAPYNLVTHTAPPGTEPFRWYVEIIPRLSVAAGFEQVTGILVNSMPPEAAARDLREAAS